MTTYSQSEPASRAPSPHGSIAVSKGMPKTPLVLVIEDDPGVMQVLLSILALRNLRTLTATSIPEALNHWELHKQELNLVLSDKWLSEYENTDNLLEWFNMSHPALPVILVTGSRLNWDEERSRKENRKLLNKPFAVADLLTLVDFWTARNPRMDHARVQDVF
ncbi:MAG: hypothetical protein JWN25_772 [Verrucomicrobiales bacterium]|jgi:DNA-binding NtrC family response regulator|nr:hypothetical protein [Verrucomicrobiales bacterium]MDB6130569.1 hypothetical protein [Verrucomicrobiales bacterium]